MANNAEMKICGFCGKEIKDSYYRSSTFFERVDESNHKARRGYCCDDCFEKCEPTYDEHGRPDFIVWIGDKRKHKR